MIDLTPLPYLVLLPWLWLWRIWKTNQAEGK